MLSKSHFISINPVNVENGVIISNKIPISRLKLWADFRNWGQETKNYDKKCFQCSYPSGNAEDLGVCEPKTVDKDKIYILLIINHNVTIMYHTDAQR